MKTGLLLGLVFEHHVHVKHFVFFVCIFACEAPDVPGPVVLNEIGILTANISWTPPNPSSPFDSYEIYVIEDETGDRRRAATVPSDGDLSYIVTGLKPTTNYTFEVGTLLFAADQFPEQRSEGNPSAQGMTSRYYDEVVQPALIMLLKK